MTRGSRRSLHPESIARIHRLELRARAVVEGVLAGLHKSPYKGQSVEFLQHREYVRGDDLRRVDWKVWGRQDRYYVKEFEEETNLRLTLLVDGSTSMDYAGGPAATPPRPTKYDCAATLAGHARRSLREETTACRVEDLHVHLRDSFTVLAGRMS